MCIIYTVYLKYLRTDATTVRVFTYNCIIQLVCVYLDATHNQESRKRTRITDHIKYRTLETHYSLNASVNLLKLIKKYSPSELFCSQEKRNHLLRNCIPLKYRLTNFISHNAHSDGIPIWYRS